MGWLYYRDKNCDRFLRRRFFRCPNCVHCRKWSWWVSSIGTSLSDFINWLWLLDTILQYLDTLFITISVGWDDYVAVIKIVIDFYSHPLAGWSLFCQFSVKLFIVVICWRIFYYGVTIYFTMDCTEKFIIVILDFGICCSIQ